MDKAINNSAFHGNMDQERLNYFLRGIRERDNMGREKVGAENQLLGSER
ncbi:MAG: hypothetical protein HY756_06805 [Nitrospirae bacterium]|nr:hypothetical protein [Nitrospirota bacterium]